MDWDIVNHLGSALAIGLIIGAERDWQNQQQKPTAAAGVRSFGFVGLLVAVPVAAAIGVIARFAISQYRDSLLYKGLEGGQGEE